MGDYVKRFVTKDGKQRVTIYRDDYAENPRYNTDEPLHCEDWARNFSIMTKDERGNKSGSAYNFLCYMLEMYGDKKKIIKILKDNYKSKTHQYHDNALFYDHSNKEWVVASWISAWTDGQKVVHEAHWGENTSFTLSLADIDVDCVIEALSTETIDYLVANAMTDGVKMMSYSFGYYNGISFSDEVTCESEGICWLEKDEFLKYAGGDNSEWVKKEEQVWKSKTLDEIEFLLDELEAWSNNDVYGFVVEDCVKSVIHKEYTNSDRDDECYEHEDWEKSDSCWGFYGELDKSLEWMLDNAGFKKDDLIEE